MTTNDFYSLIAQNDLTLVDFYATWCGPCKAMDPIIDRLSAILNKRATIIRIDIDRKEHREIVARYNTWPYLHSYCSATARSSGARAA